jgi:two-component system chemotaxis response regulator CheY
MAIDPNMKILVIDDYKTMRRIIINLLAQLGFHNVEEATDGESGLKKLLDGSFNLVVSDWNMEPMDGYTLLQKVRALDNAQKKLIPFIMVTAESKPENIIKAKKAGVNNYIVKPFTADTLKKKLDAVFG